MKITNEYPQKYDIQVFDDRTVPTLDMEMLNTLRGTGIQVEIHQVMMIVIS